MRYLRNWKKETEQRVGFLKEEMKKAGACGLVFGNSGGKDSALVGILCSMATDNVYSVAMPCGSSRNFGEDLRDATALSEKFGIPMETVDLTETRETLMKAAGEGLSDAAISNIAPRLRMTLLYLLAQSRNCLVVGTGNRSEIYMGYFTKWGDGGYDINPIADLGATEIFDFLRYLGAPENIITKAPSAGLVEGQTDEGDMGVTYEEIDRFMDGGEVGQKSAEIIMRYHARSGHKREMPHRYGEEK